MDTSTRVEMGQIGDFEWNQPFSSGGWFMLRSAPNFTSSKVAGALISKMDSTQHDRGWVLAAENGMISVELADQAPKEQPAPDKPKKGDQKVKKKVEAPKVIRSRRTPTPMRAIKVATVTPLPTNGQWDHLFFTYDGSGRAAGVKLYVNGAPVATKVISDTLAATACARQRRCNWGGNPLMSNRLAIRATRISVSMRGH